MADKLSLRYLLLFLSDEHVFAKYKLLMEDKIKTTIVKEMQSLLGTKVTNWLPFPSLPKLL